MFELLQLRQAELAAPIKRLGLDPRFERVWGPQVTAMGHEDEMSQWGEPYVFYVPLQTPAGTPYFTAGVDSFDSTNLLA